MHKSVLLQQSIDNLKIKPGDIFVDGTLGGGGHIEEVCRRFGSSISYVGLDLDQDAIERTKKKLKSSQKVNYVLGSFRDIDKHLTSLKIKKADKILLDLGLSSNQLEESGRGFSFQKDEPLMMSFKKDLKPDDLTAREILNTWDMENIATIISGYGEEKFAWRIAKAIVEKRKMKPIETTDELVEIIKTSTPKFYHHKGIHPATRTFQALRMAVNDEINALREGVEKSFNVLNKKGRLAIISFHSLEDRIVKQVFKQREVEKVGKIVTKKPITPEEKELEENPRSRSAKLRVIEKIK